MVKFQTTPMPEVQTNERSEKSTNETHTEKKEKRLMEYLGFVRVFSAFDNLTFNSFTGNLVNA